MRVIHVEGMKSEAREAVSEGFELSYKSGGALWMFYMQASELTIDMF
jgi:hypothetical protein